MSLVRVQALAQALLSAYAVYTSVVTIRKLQQYEPATKKAAQYTDKAGRELHKTRTTQASGALSTLFSLVTSAGVFLGPLSASRAALLALSAVNVTTTLAARAHMAAHWGDKWQVPGVRDFSDAVKNSKALQLQLAYLAAGWVLLTATQALQMMA